MAVPQVEPPAKSKLVMPPERLAGPKVLEAMRAPGPPAILLAVTVQEAGLLARL